MTRLYLLDCGSLCRPMYEATKTEHGGMLTALDSWLDNFTRRLQPTYALACFDCGDSGRKAIDSSYKGKRPPPDPDYVGQLLHARKVVNDHGIAFAWVPPFEADDVIASAIAQHSDSVDCIIVSEDKDLFALVSGLSVQQYAPQRGIFFDEAAVTERLVSPWRVSDFLALAGDTADGIRGIAGIGKDTAIKAIKQTSSMAELFRKAAAKELVDISPARQKKIANGVDQYEHAMRLVKLRTDVPVPRNLNDLRVHAREAA